MNEVSHVQIAACSVHKSGALLLEDREGQFWDENLVRLRGAEQPSQQQCALGGLLAYSLPTTMLRNTAPQMTLMCDTAQSSAGSVC